MRPTWECQHRTRPLRDQFGGVRMLPSVIPLVRFFILGLRCGKTTLLRMLAALLEPGQSYRITGNQCWQSHPTKRPLNMVFSALRAGFR